MAPFVPDIIGNDLNYIVAIIIGFGFGFVLEQAGFSTSKKLVGLFYGYDFTVLRVFFTAGITAMFGVTILTHFGLLDSNLIFINPTFLWSAIVGGLIMGLGFILGGYCPGTSVCGAAIGKIDGIFFMLGSFLGVFLFAEGYPFFEKLYKADNWGGVKISTTMGIPTTVAACGLILVAVFAFWAVSYVEMRVNKKPMPKIKDLKNYLIVSCVVVALAISALFMPDRREDLLTKAENASLVANYPIQKMNLDEFAFRVVDQDKSLQIIDLRTPKEFSDNALPNSYNYTLANLFDKEIAKTLNIRDKKYIFIANDEQSERKGAYIASELGYPNIFILENGMAKFNADILNYQAQGDSTRKLSDRERFIAKASLEVPKLIQQNKASQSQGEKKGAKRVLGGC